MASQIRDVTLPMPPAQAYGLVRASGFEIPKFRNIRDDPATLTLAWNKGWGWSNPVTVQVAIYQGPDQGSSLVRYEASILALADPFGFTTKTLEQFIGHLHAHQQALATGTQAPPPPKDTHAVKVNIIMIAVIFGLMFLMCGGIFAIAVLGR